MNIPKINANYAVIDDIFYNGYGPDVVTGAMDLGLFDALLGGAAEAASLSRSLGTVENLTEALADALVSLKLLKKSGGAYSLTPEAELYLTSSSGAYMESSIRSNLGFAALFKNIPTLLKNGVEKPGKEMWYGLDTLKSIGKSSLGGSLQDAVAFVTALPEFPGMKRMCDLAGNHGFYTMALLDRNPNLRGTICDLPKVAESASELVREMGYAVRVDTIGVDLETDESFGEGYDMVFTSHMLYWWKGRLTDIFKRIHDALNPGGIFISNHCAVPKNGEDAVPVAMLELMTRLAGFPGHHLPEEDMKDALSVCGFDDFTVQKPEDSAQHHSLILAARKK